MGSESPGVAVGECPEHGLVTGDELDWNFPNPATCWCGATLDRATVADAAEVARHA